MRTCIVLACSLWLMGTNVALAQSTTTQGVFSEEQAKRGASAYNANILRSHRLKTRKLSPKHKTKGGTSGFRR